MDAFRAGMNTNEPEDQVAEMLTAMRRELVATKAALSELTAEAGRVQLELGRERESLAQCERRALMAERIGDAETGRVAHEFMRRHSARVRVLEGKYAAIDAELMLLSSESGEMMARYRQMEVNRFALVARMRAAGSGAGSHSAADGSGGIPDVDRITEWITRDGEAPEAEARSGQDSGAATPPRSEQIEARLREMKSRLGKAE
ncbi:MAG: hypothetical protein LBG44_01880 [Gemmatimonadota bacterium]|jgi:phage shock protein A|nr:hypothetical protein [Gemmatimonadota bacterium]